MLDLSQVAARLNVSRNGVRSLIRYSGLPAIVLNARTIRIEADALENWIASRRKG
jgi:excisionase family DNA binding protein